MDTRVTPTRLIDVRSKNLVSQPAGLTAGFINPDQEPRFVIKLDVDGPAAEAAIRYGHFKLTAARDNLGDPLKLSSQESFNGDPVQGWVEIDRESMFFFSGEQPKDKLQLELRLEPPSRSAEKIALLEGSLKLWTMSRKQEIVIDGVSNYVGQELQHEALAGAGLRIRLLSKEQAAGSMWIGGDDNSAVHLEIGGNRDNLVALELVDASGEPLSRGSFSMESNGSFFKSLQCDGPVPPSARLNISVALGTREVTVPFKFENLPLP